MKPHIYKSKLEPGKWVCHRSGSFPGFGPNPESAYLDWRWRNRFRLTFRRLKP